MITTIVVFACSIKHGGKCLAGKRINDKTWVRPVGDHTGKELTNVQATCENKHGTFPIKLLQKLVIDIDQHVPLRHQPENFILNNTQIKQSYKIEKSEISNYLDEPYDLWGQGADVSAADINKGVIDIKQSLYLVKVDNLELLLNSFGKRRARFSYNKIDYDLSVTCPSFDALLESGEETNNILCISLGEEYEHSHWKIVAAIY